MLTPNKFGKVSASIKGAGFHTGFFVGGGKFGARLRAKVVPTFQGYNKYSFQMVYGVLCSRTLGSIQGFAESLQQGVCKVKTFPNMALY